MPTGRGTIISEVEERISHFMVKSKFQWKISFNPDPSKQA